VISILSQSIFTFEAFVKIAAEGTHPERYFTDREDGSWNCLDFFIVLVGFLELTPAAFIFKNFPVVLLRLCRLLRVFRLAKALPRLRSIVEALISGFSSVGWICILIAVLNYIVSCMCMIFFRDNDAFHFGSLGRSMFTVLRIETLDTWDQILYVAMFGCAKYPAGNTSNQFNVCVKNTSFGWIGAVVLFFVTIIGAYVLPIVLIGVVSIKFDEASKFLEILKKGKSELQRHLEIAHKTLPGFFTQERLIAIEDVFHTLDSSGEYSLDMSEIAPFFHYTVDHLFGIEMTPEQCESLFLLLDSNHTTEIGQGEFVTFIAILKKMSRESMKDPEFAQKAFGDDAKKVKKNRNKVRDDNKSAWDAAMERVDKDSYNAAWDAVLRSVNGVNKGSSLKEKVETLFADFDSDGTGELDIEELVEGLQSCGIRLNHRQQAAFVKSVDEHVDGNITVDEFVTQIEKVSNEKAEIKQKSNEK
jgi:Ca2+-binding EF-hand superfamily protein